MLRGSEVLRAHHWEWVGLLPAHDHDTINNSSWQRFCTQHFNSSPVFQHKQVTSAIFHSAMQQTTVYIVLSLLAAATVSSSGAETHSLQEVIDYIQEKREVLSQHDFFSFLADTSVPARKRMQFVPYFGYFAIAGADLLDSWFRIPNPQNELERRVNTFIDEDNFHYNLFVTDMEDVLGYNTTRFGSYEAIVRHIWGDDSRAVRMLVYVWGSVVTKTKDPTVYLASFEAVEACLKHLFENANEYIFRGENGLPDLRYFGQTHIDFEKNHTLTSWFKEGDDPFRPLASYQMSKEAKELSLEVVDDLFYWYVLHIGYLL